jgi:2-C-methyl-D-erythritol 4-phosphate cytidylyltransferase
LDPHPAAEGQTLSRKVIEHNSGNGRTAASDPRRNRPDSQIIEREPIIMPQFAAILPAAGKSRRFADSRRKKVFTELKGRAVWVRAAEHFTERDDVIQTIVVVSSEDLEFFREKFQPNLAFMGVEIVAGGAERADSVANALQAVRDEAEYVAIHDAARPLLAKKWIDEVFAAAVQSGAAILGHPVASTLKRVDAKGRISETVSREHLWEAQTPQVFRRDLLVEAFAQRNGFQATDEAQLVERLGHPVSIVENSAMNLKITTQEDLRIAEKLLDALPKEKAFRGLHPFADEDPRGL